MKHSKSGLFLMELIVAFLFFSLASAICVQLFVKADTINEESIRKKEASSIAGNLIELYKNDRPIEKDWLYFDTKGNLCEKDSSTYKVHLNQKQQSLAIHVYYKEKEIYNISQVVDKLYILKIYKTNLKKVVERFLLLGDFW